jgi:hypothetical protein
VPYNVRTGRKASVTDPTQYSTFFRAVQAYERGSYDGIGFALGDGWVGYDLDHCRDPETGELLPWAQAIIDAWHTYAEASQSGTGVHGIGHGAWPVDARHKIGPVEAYGKACGSDRFFTVTGAHLEGTPTTITDVSTRTDILSTMLTAVGEYLNPKKPDPQPTPAAAQDYAPAVELDDEAILAHLFGAKNGAKMRTFYDGDNGEHPSDSEADLALCSGFAFYTDDLKQIDRLFRGSARLRPKWDQPSGQGMTYGERTITRALQNGGARYSGRRPTQPPDDAQPAASSTEAGQCGPQCAAEKAALRADNDFLREENADLRRRLQVGARVARNTTLSAGVRHTVLVVGRVIENATRAGKDDDGWVKVWEPDLAAAAGVAKVSEHLKILADQDIIETRVKREIDPESGTRKSRLWLRSCVGNHMVDIGERAATVGEEAGLPKRGAAAHRCRDCGSENLVKRWQIVCRDCGAVQDEGTFCLNSKDRNSGPPEDDDSIPPVDIHIDAQKRKTDGDRAERVAGLSTADIAEVEDAIDHLYEQALAIVPSESALNSKNRNSDELSPFEGDGLLLYTGDPFEEAPPQPAALPLIGRCERDHPVWRLDDGSLGPCVRCEEGGAR